MIRKWLWFLPYYRLKIFKISLKKIKKNNNYKNICFIYINSSLDVKSFSLDSSLQKKVIFLNRKDFKEWFEKSKNKQTKFLFVSNIRHCLYEYRIIRSNGYKAYMLVE